MTFAHPKLLYLLLLVPILIAWYIFRQKDSKASLQISTLAGFSKAPFSFLVYLRHLPVAFRILAIALVIVVLARPQSSNTWQNVATEGIDIMIALDISSSMLARDFEPDRIEAAKNIGIQFISGRRNDRLGLAIFAGESFTMCPLTTDHASVINMFKDIKMGLLEDGTAIGSGLATAVTRLAESDAISRVVILLTDGVNNRGEVAPLTAAEIAKTYGVRVYAVGIGSQGMAPYPVQTPFGTRYQDMKVEIDEEVLTQIAEMTGGKYFRATDNEALKKVYEEIDRLEKTKIEVTEFSKKQEEYRLYAFIALALLASEVLLRTTVLRSIP
ncbi:MAG TPA: VWA domain-containing protein [Tenuifilaceae bacterium]|nr:VWA domain-containing protein [Tenuifilaceae bacterium]HPE18026.1 VWA domain-containing protein [Tenuifilaceae bacterium]HPJ44612.1 VWA domain-containing protein [Tenuifilaceae bacterium]HPQ33986.1 VWA domain-containing protein [Tenuifilaceae bacterium]HRX68519.1 VWA domain-containing protein [Tenuifilaceae bacterium]